MSLAEDLLNSLEEDGATAYSADDVTTPHIVINADKTVTIPKELKRILVQHEHNITTVIFDCPRYFGGHDLFEMGLKVVFQRADGHKESHPVENLRVDESDTNTIHFDWTISRNTTLAGGEVRITICAKDADVEGVAEREWHTIPNQDLFVNEGMECSDDEIVEQYPDVIESILVRLDTLESASNSGSGSGQNVNGWTTEQINLLDQLFDHIPFKSDEGGAIADALIASLRSGSSGDSGDEEEPDTPAATEKTLSGISAAYTGGDVAVGTAVTALTGVVVTAHYSDGTSEIVTGYTLNGTIAEGSNTITVTYQGKTATFTVTGAAESSGETVDLLASAKINIGTKFSWYTDEGATAYTGSIATKQALIGIASADTFDADTDVTVYLKATAQTYDHFVATSTQWDGVDVHGTDGSVVNLNCVEVGGKAWTSAGINHKITIKVKAGMRLAVFSYASDFGNPVSITAEVA